MRLLLSFLLLLSISSTFAQELTVDDFRNDGLRKYKPNTRLAADSARKWSLNSFSGISTSFIGWKGGSATVVAAPMGLQLTRKLDNHFFAFGAVSIAPSYVNFNQRFMNVDISKNAGSSSFMRGNNFGINPRAELGLGYTNEERTFQISASIGVSRNQFPYSTGLNNGWNPAFTNSFNQGFGRQF